MSWIASAIVYFVVCHGGPAAHFSEFSKTLRQEGYQVEILATGPALEKCHQLNEPAKEFNPNKKNPDDPSDQKALAEELSKNCATAHVVITDIAHPLMEQVHAVIEKKFPKVKHFAYYDNPEPFVPGGYSSVAAKVMAQAKKILFSNAKLTKEVLYAAPQEIIRFPEEKRIGIGYYPLENAKKIEQLRTSSSSQARRDFFNHIHLTDQGQKILLYLGGNNEVYFSQALPAFLQYLQEAAPKLDPSQYIVLFQQHPGAKAKAIDLSLVQRWKRESNDTTPLLVISEMSSEEAQIVADAAFYYQTSLGPQLILAHIPTFQVGHETYPDVLIRNHLAPSITSSTELSAALKNLLSTPPCKCEPQKMLDDLGIAKDWQKNLRDCL